MAAHGIALDRLCDRMALQRRGNPFGVRLMFNWRDLWVGVFLDHKKHRIYVLPVPMFGIVIQLAWHESDAEFRERAKRTFRGV